MNTDALDEASFVRFNPGSATGLVGSTALALLGDPPETPVVRAARDAVMAGCSFEAFAETLAGHDLSSLPDFAGVFSETAGARLITRGSVEATVRFADGSQRVFASPSAQTWSEELLHDAIAVRLHTRDQLTDVTDIYRVAAGVVPARALEWGQEIERDLSAGSHAEADETSAAAVEEEPTARAAAPDADSLLAERPASASVEGVPEPVRLIDWTATAEGPEQLSDRPPGLVDNVPLVTIGSVDAGGPIAQEQPDYDSEEADDRTMSAAAFHAALAAGHRSADGDRVPSVRCQLGHPNPPHSATCRSCGAPITDRHVVLIDRPVLGVLRFDDGRVVGLDGPLVLGRRPSAPEGPQEPVELVALDDPEKLLSRTHAEVRLDGWQVLVVDRGSVNYTFVSAPGQQVVQLKPDVPHPILPGTRVSLADAASFVFEAATAPDGDHEF